LDKIVIPRDRGHPFGCGYRMEARFILRKGKTLLRIPNRALFRHENGRAVFVPDQGRAPIRPVESGRRIGLRTRIAAGLAPDEMIATHRIDRVADGMRLDVEIKPDRSVADRPSHQVRFSSARTK
jgi:HlyD family secretion protein